MIGLFVGALFGAITLYILRILVKRILSGDARLSVLILMNLLATLAPLVTVALVFPDQLAWCAAGLCGVLVAGSIAGFAVHSRKGGRDAGK